MRLDVIDRTSFIAAEEAAVDTKLMPPSFYATYEEHTETNWAGNLNAHAS
jgi:hypothetical protein